MPPPHFTSSSQAAPSATGSQSGTGSGSGASAGAGLGSGVGPGGSGANSSWTLAELPKTQRHLVREALLHIKTALVTDNDDDSALHAAPAAFQAIDKIVNDATLRQLRRKAAEGGAKAKGGAGEQSTGSQAPPMSSSSSAAASGQAGAPSTSSSGAAATASATATASASAATAATATAATTAEANLPKHVSHVLSSSLFDIFSDSMDQNSLSRNQLLVEFLHALHSILEPRCIVLEWWDVVLRPMLKNPKCHVSVAACARELVVWAMTQTPANAYVDESPPSAIWPPPQGASVSGDYSEVRTSRKPGDAPYPSSSTRSTSVHRSTSSQGADDPIPAAFVLPKRGPGAADPLRRFTQRIFDLYTSEATSAGRNLEDVEREGEAEDDEDEDEDEDEEKEERDRNQQQGKEQEKGRSSDDQQRDADLVGTTWKGNLEAILLTYGDEKAKPFFHHLSESYLDPAARLPILLLLTIFLRIHSVHTYYIISTPLVRMLVLSLQLDTSRTSTSLGLTALVMLLPHIPNWLANGGAGGLPALLSIFARVVDWRRLGPGWEERQEAQETGEEEGWVVNDRLARRLHIRKGIDWKRLDSSFDTAPTAPPDAGRFFTVLYGIFPCNVVRFLRAPIDYLRKAECPTPLEADWEDVIDEVSVQHKSAPILRRHLLHPALIELDAEKEISDKQRWSDHDAANIAAECTSLDLGHMAGHEPGDGVGLFAQPGSAVEDRTVLLDRFLSAWDPLELAGGQKPSSIEQVLLQRGGGGASIGETLIGGVEDDLARQHAVLSPRTSILQHPSSNDGRTRRFSRQRSRSEIVSQQGRNALRAELLAEGETLRAGREGTPAASSPQLLGRRRDPSVHFSPNLEAPQHHRRRSPRGSRATSMTSQDGSRPSTGSNMDGIFASYLPLRWRVDAAAASRAFPNAPSTPMTEDRVWSGSEGKMSRSTSQRSNVGGTPISSPAGHMPRAFPAPRSNLASAIMSPASSAESGADNSSPSRRPLPPAAMSAQGSFSLPPSPINRAHGHPAAAPASMTPSKLERNRSGSISSVLSLANGVSEKNLSTAATATATTTPTPLRLHHEAPSSSSSSASSSSLVAPTALMRRASAEGGPTPLQQIQALQTSPPAAARMTSSSRAQLYKELKYLQSENLMLRKELNYEMALKDQHVQHMGRLHRDKFNDTALEAERQNLYQTVRSLRGQLSALQASTERQRSEAATIKTRHAAWEAELNGKLKQYREERKTWTSESRRLRSQQDEDAMRIRQLEAELEDTGREMVEMREKLGLQTREVGRVNEYKERARKLEECLRYWGEDVERYEEQRREVEVLWSRWGQMEEVLSAADGQVEALRDQVEQMEARNEALERELRDMRHKQNLRDVEGSRDSQEGATKVKRHGDEGIEGGDGEAAEREKLKRKVEALEVQLLDLKAGEEERLAQRLYQERQKWVEAGARHAAVVAPQSGDGEEELTEEGQVFDHEIQPLDLGSPRLQE